jgi:hypothetical protein
MRVGGIGTEGGIGAGGEVFCSMRFLASIDHGGRRRPTATTRPPSRRGSIQQSANMLGNRLVSLKLENILNRGDIAVRRTANGLGESFFVFLLDN